MPMCYKVDLLAVLKEAGYNTNRIRKEKIMGEAMLHPSYPLLSLVQLQNRVKTDD